MWANHAVRRPRPAATLTVMSPLRNWTTIQKPSTMLAGQRTITDEEAEDEEHQHSRVGEQQEVRPEHPDDGPARPDHRHARVGMHHDLREGRRHARRAGRRRGSAPCPSVSSTLSPKIHR